MNELTTHFEQIRLFCQQHLPAATMDNIVPVAVLSLVVGVLLSVVGAKLARAGFTLAFVAAGAFAGYRFGGLAEVPLSLCVLGGALMIGVIGFVTFRLWVGAAVAAVVATAALGAFGYQNLLPHLPEFEQTHMTASAAVGQVGDFAVPSPEENSAFANGNIATLGKKFWAFAKQKDASLERRALVWGIAALVTGLFLGVLTIRWALVLSTSFLGTVLVGGGAATLFTHFFPQSLQSFQAHPGIGASAVGTFLVMSLVLQTMLTRATPKTNDETAQDS